MVSVTGDRGVAARAAKAFVWGYNNTGELGLGHAARVFTPSPALLPPGVVDLQGGTEFSVALTSSGQVWSWGANTYGQLGDGTRIHRRRSRRVRLPHSAKATAIAAGTDHVLVLTTRGEVLAWGRNHRGQLGTGTTRDQLSPRRVPLEPVTTIAAGDGISAAISAAHRLITWGRNGANQLGLKADAGAVVMKPTRSGLITTRVVAVDAGLRHLMVLTWDGRVLALGAGPTGKPLTRHVPLKPTWGRVRAISVGDDHTVALTNRGLVLAWGANRLGQLGSGDTNHRVTPVHVPLPAAKGRAVAIRAGHRHTMVVTDRHEIYVWGDGRFGAVGTGRPKPDATSYLLPKAVPGLTGAVPTGLGGGGNNCAVFVDRGPATALVIEPASATVALGKSIQYKVRTVDTFGTDLGPAPSATTLTAPGGTVRGLTVTAKTVGSAAVTARVGHLIGHATLHVSKGK